MFMPTTLCFILGCLCAFLAGSIPFGLLLVHLAGKGDVRSQGSGNIGATNVMRSGGTYLGVLTLLLDATKGFLPVFLAKKSGWPPEALAFIGLAATLGHMYTPWLRFNGGKGVATALGVILAFHAPMALPPLAVFILLLAIFRYVSLGSIFAALTVPVAAMGFLGRWATLPILESAARWHCLAWSLLALLVIRKHAANITRLLNGTESKLWGSSQKPTA